MADYIGYKKTQVDAIISALPSAGSGTGTSFVPTSSTALLRMYSGLAKRDIIAVPIVTTGSSTPQGQGATNDNRSLFNRFVNNIQRDYPLSNNAAQPTQRDYAAGMTLSVGIGHIRAGVGGTNSGDYLTDAKCSGIGALNPVIVTHMIGSNDYSINRNPATVKSDILSWANKIDAAVTNSVVPVHILVHGHRRTNVSSPTYSWNAYGTKMQELSIDYPDRFVFVNLYDSYRKLGQDSVYQHPFMFYSGGPNDGIHLTDMGHTFGADALWSALRESFVVNTAAPTALDPANPTAPADTAAPTISTFTASNGNAQSVLAWDGTDNVGITRWLLKRSGTTIYDGTAKTYTDTGLTNGTTYSYGLTAYDAAGNSATASASATPANSTTLSNSTAPSISPSSPTTGQTLTASNGTWSATPDSYTYIWKRAGTAISGATAQTYVTVSADQGQAITVEVTAIKSGYTNGVATSASVTPVASGGGGSDYTIGMLADYDFNSLALADGAAITALNPTAASSATTAQMTTYVASPIYRTAGPNGMGYGQFGGTGTSDAKALTVLGDKLTVPRESTYFFIIRRTGTMGRAFGAGQNESNNYHVFFDQANNGSFDFSVGTVGASTTERLTYLPGTSATGRWMIVAVQARAAGSTSRMKIGLTEGVVTGNLINTQTNYGVSFGVSGARTGYGNFDLARWRVYNSALTDAQVDQVMTYLSNLYGITT